MHALRHARTKSNWYFFCAPGAIAGAPGAIRGAPGDISGALRARFDTVSVVRGVAGKGLAGIRFTTRHFSFHQSFGRKSILRIGMRDTFHRRISFHLGVWVVE